MKVLAVCNMHDSFFVCFSSLLFAGLVQAIIPRTHTAPKQVGLLLMFVVASLCFKVVTVDLVSESLPPFILSSFPGLPHFCSSVCIQYNTWKRKTSEKQGMPIT